jgi:uncharacterized protein YggU (UPF0235/DUF167 family)
MEQAKERLLTTGSLRLKVTPRAARECIEGYIDDAGGNPLLKVKVTAVAEDGKANEAIIALIASQFGIPKSRLAILRGATSRIKVIGYQ